MIHREEALAQIEYLKKLVDEARARIAGVHQFFFLWGLVWIVGYLGSWKLDDGAAETLWAVAVSIGGAGSLALGVMLNRRGRSTAQSSSLGRKLALMNIVLIAGLSIMPVVFFDGTTTRGETTYPPFVVGFIYVLNGIYIGRSLLWPGLWVLAITGMSFAFSVEGAALWLAVAGGGGLLASGELLRRLNRSVA